MKSVSFLLPKHPFAFSGGDTRLSRIVIEAVARAYSVRVLALWDASPATPQAIPISIFPKPVVRPWRLLASSVVRRRSLIHQRFESTPLSEALQRHSTDIIIAEHTYMAEAALSADPDGARERLFVNSHVLESEVLRRRTGRLAPLWKMEADRTLRDEIRCTTRARSTACFGSEDLHILRAAGARQVRRLDLVLPPAPAPARPTSPIALFIGDRAWPPNAEALLNLLEMWPQIEARVAGATLDLIGRPGPNEAEPSLVSVRRLGFVPDLDEVSQQACVLLAPVATGGGVRVKILEAARLGLPVVATPAAAGSIPEYLPLTVSHSRDSFIDGAVALLSDIGRARREGEALFEANRTLVAQDFVAHQVDEWIGAQDR